MKTKFPETLHPKLRLVFDYWSGLKAKLGRLPALDEIDLMDLWRVAPNLFILDLERSTDSRDRFLWRYWGTTLVNFTGVELTGKRLDQTHAEEAVVEAVAAYRWVLESGKPHYWQRGVRINETGKDFLRFERIALPLLDRDRKPGHILGVAVPIDPKAPEELIRTGRLEINLG